MTHEREPDDEAPGGPEQDHRLPDAGAIRVTDGPGDLDPDVVDDTADPGDRAADDAKLSAEEG